MKELKNLISLSGEYVLVIGGSGYLGAAVSEVCAELGANVIIASRNIHNCRNVVNKLPNQSNQIHSSIKCDITLDSDLTSLSSYLVENAICLKALIVCMWDGKKNSWSTITSEDWSHEINVNLSSNFRLIKAIEDCMSLNSSIILTSSMYGIVAPQPTLYQGVPQENPPSYGVAKAGTIQLVKYLSVWLAPKKIRVNCISPGPFPFPEVKNNYPEFVERLEDRCPLGRVGTPEDLKGVYALLASDASKYINGQNISVDGGWTIW